jgi:hypothetical protein
VCDGDYSSVVVRCYVLNSILQKRVECARVVLLLSLLLLLSLRFVIVVLPMLSSYYTAPGLEIWARVLMPNICNMKRGDVVTEAKQAG